jgi:hypothetical protein
MMNSLDNEYSYYNNRTLDGIPNNLAKRAWTGYSLFVVLSSLIGDTTILIASIKYKAIRLHKFIVITIQHIAFCDLLVSAGVVFPILTSQLANGWVLGNLLCHICSYLSHTLYSVSTLLICTMVTAKLIIIKHPLRSRSISMKKAHLICFLFWLTAPSVAFLLMGVGRRDAYFSYRSYTCAYVFSAKEWLWLRPLLATMLLFVTTSLVVASTISLMVTAKQVAKRGREHLRKRGINTTILIATVYSISTLPYALYRFGENMIDSENKSQGFFHTKFFRLAVSFLFFNTISNFYIYCMTVGSFRRFLLSRMKLLFQFLAKSGTTNDNYE